MMKALLKTWVCICLLLPMVVYASPAIQDFNLSNIQQSVTKHPNQSAAYVLDRGEDALLMRAWLADHAQKSIEVQYFIWSDDNIGTIATESLLRAAERGVKVRVIVDDLLIDAPDKTILALAQHPNIDICIYNPKHSVGTPTHKRIMNMLLDFRGFNQRMHDKVFIVDDLVAITGGRNMADEYFDFDHEYNFRDRDVLLFGKAVQDISASFERFWGNPISVLVQYLYDGLGIMQTHLKLKDDTPQHIYDDLHHYANAPENFEPMIRQQIKQIPNILKPLLQHLNWTDITVINDPPGKNDNTFSLGGGSRTAAALGNMIEQARQTIVIQSPYLILTDEAEDLLRRKIKQGVKVRISTNSMASTDNLQAFSGYKNQRSRLLKMGIDIFEYNPEAKNQAALMQRSEALAKSGHQPIFAIHAKSAVVDEKIVYIGTFNLDPRSINLNTETGVIIHDEQLAKQVEQMIENDMLPENSWNAKTDDPDSHSSFLKRSKIFLWQWMPIKSLL
jgi:putative cardiolipin synthase